MVSSQNILEGLPMPEPAVNLTNDSLRELVLLLLYFFGGRNSNCHEC